MIFLYTQRMLCASRWNVLGSGSHLFLPNPENVFFEGMGTHDEARKGLWLECNLEFFKIASPIFCHI